MSSRLLLIAIAVMLAVSVPVVGCQPQAEEPPATQETSPPPETETVPEPAGEATISATDQPGATASVTVDRAVAPEGGWLVVHLNNDGKPGPRIGLVQLQPGENTAVQVPLEMDGKELTDELITAVHMDTGQQGEFEFDPEKFEAAMEAAPEGQEPDMTGILDPPYFVGGMEAATMFSVK